MTDQLETVAEAARLAALPEVEALRAAGRVAWEPQDGSQRTFLRSPVFETLYEGTRGPGKTDALLMDFAQHVGQGFGKWWRGILFREEATQLEDVVAKTARFFARIFPTAKFLGGGVNKWKFATGEELLLRHIRVPKDYWKYHGHEYPWIGFEELTNWPFADCYESMMSCCRSSAPFPNMPRKLRATCNPYGVGHGWVKRRFIDPAPRGKVIRDKQGRARVAIHGSIYENKILLKADPDYLKNLKALTDKNKRKAWLKGSWDIVTGGILDGCWDRERHVLKRFVVPHGWRVDRAFDWGSSRPYAVGWFAESDGLPFNPETGMTPTEGQPSISFPRGSVIMVGELYGVERDQNGAAIPNAGTRETNREICQQLRKREQQLRQVVLKLQGDVLAGPADTSIFDVVNGDSYAAEMARHGVRWEPAYKGRGSRVQGWERLRDMLREAAKAKPEAPGFWVTEDCVEWQRTVPTLVRDEKNPDDVDTSQEDHCGDMTRYRILKNPAQAGGVINLGWAH